MWEPKELLLFGKNGGNGARLIPVLKEQLSNSMIEDDGDGYAEQSSSKRSQRNAADHSRCESLHDMSELAQKTTK